MTWKKPSNCSCGTGGYTAWGDTWVVIERRKPPRTSRLKCLRCGWKWWSSCRYVDKLPDHVERRIRAIADQDVLDRICEGSLVVVMGDRPEVFSFQQNTREWQRLVVYHREGKRGGSYRFVLIWKNGGRKKVALHRLVWMFANRQLVPEGMHVDHIDGPSDAIDNLRLLQSSVNCSHASVDYTDDVPF